MSVGTGISFDKNSARFVALRLRGRKGTVIDHAEQPLSPEDFTFNDALEPGGAPHKHLAGSVAASLPPSESTTRLLSLPFKRSEQIAKTIRFETENAVAAYNHTDSVLSYRRLACANGSSGPPHSLMFTVSGKRRAVKNVIEALKPLNAKPITLETDVSAVYNLMSFIDAFPAKGRGVVACISGTNWAYLFFSDDGALVNARRIRLPGDDAGRIAVLSRDIMRSCAELQIDPAQIRGRAVGSALSDTDAAGDISRQTGISFETAGIEDYIALPDGMNGGWEVALGLAVRNAGWDRSIINLRTEEFALKGKSTVLFSLATLFLAALLATGISWRGTYLSNLGGAQDHLSATNAEMEKLFKAVYPNKDPAGTDMAKAIKKAAAVGGNFSDNTAARSSLVIVKALEDAMKKVGPAAEFEIETWDYAKGNKTAKNTNKKVYGLKVRINLKKGGYGQAEQLVKELEKHKHLFVEMPEFSEEKWFRLIIAFKGETP